MSGYDYELNVPLKNLLWLINSLKEDLVDVEEAMSEMGYEAYIWDKKSLEKLNSLSIKREVGHAKISLLYIIIGQYSGLSFEEITDLVGEVYIEGLGKGAFKKIKN